MATLITKNSSTAAAVPGTGDIVQGELAVNVADKRLFTKDAGGTVVEVGTNPSSLVVTGDVGIGTSSPLAKLDVNGAGRFGSTLDMVGGAGSTLLRFYNNSRNYSIKNDVSGSFLAIRDENAAADRLIVDASGNLGLGVTPSAWASNYRVLQQAQGGGALVTRTDSVQTHLSSNWYYDGTDKYYAAGAASRYTQISGQHQWWNAVAGPVNGTITTFTQAMTLDASGDLLVGTTTLSAVGNTIFGSSVPGVIHQNNNAAANGFVFTSYRRSSVEIGSVSQNGTTAVLFNTTSDRRLKDNIVLAPSASAVIDAIEIVSHDWKSAPDEHVTYGVIAQDLALVAPQAVLQGDAGDEIEKTWGVDYSKLVPMLIKEIQSLRARVAALETP